MYCMNCGVKLGEGEEKCPLCGLPAYHPQIERTAGKKMYPGTWEAPRPERGSFRFLLTTSMVIAFLTCLLINLLIRGSVTWSYYVMIGLAAGFIVFVLPLFFKNPLWAALLPIDMVTSLVLLFLINQRLGGHWFWSFAFPVTLLYGLLFTAIYVVARYVRKGWFYILGGSLIALGCSTMLLELLLHLTFHVRMFRWSLYPTASLSAIGLFWILCGIVKPLGNEIRKRFFI